MSKLAKYLKNNDEAKTDKKGYIGPKSGSLSFDPYIFLFIATAIIISAFYVYKIYNAKYFKGIEFPNFNALNSKYENVVSDYKNFKVDNSYFEFIKAIKQNSREDAMNIAKESNNIGLLGIYEAVYGDVEKSINFLTEEYKKTNNPLYLHYLVFSYGKDNKLNSIKNLIDSAKEIMPETNLLYGVLLEKNKFYDLAYAQYVKALKDIKSNEIKNKLVVKVKFLEKYLAKKS